MSDRNTQLVVAGRNSNLAVNRPNPHLDRNTRSVVAGRNSNLAVTRPSPYFVRNTQLVVSGRNSNLAVAQPNPHLERNTQLVFAGRNSNSAVAQPNPYLDLEYHLQPVHFNIASRAQTQDFNIQDPKYCICIPCQLNGEAKSSPQQSSLSKFGYQIMNKFFTLIICGFTIFIFYNCYFYTKKVLKIYFIISYLKVFSMI